MDEHFATAWEAIADLFPEDLALAHGTSARTWREFDERASRLAAGLAAAGVGPGDTVAIDLYNCNEYLETFFAALKIRAVPANVNYRYLHEELRHLLHQAGARVLVFHASLAERVLPASAAVPDLRMIVAVDDCGGSRSLGPGTVLFEDLITEHAPAPRILRSSDDVFLSFTGGTTGMPKGVEYVVGNSMNTTFHLARQNLGIEKIDWDAPSIDRATALREWYRTPLAVPASPMMHSTGLIMASLPVLTLGGAVVTLTSHHFDADELFVTVAEHRASTVSIVGDAFARPMLRALELQAATGRPYNTSSLITITSAGLAWSAPVKDALLEYMSQVTLVDACGSTEGGTIGLQVVRYGDPTSTDRFTPAPGLRLVRADGSTIAPDSDEIGQFLLPTVSRGYRNDPERTAATYRIIDGQYFVMPGDWGRWNPDGTVTLIGRGTSTINTGGEKVYPEEVEKVLTLHPDIEDCLVFGLPVERFGQRVVALVQPAPGRAVEPTALVQHLRERIASYKVPKEIRVGAIPRAPNGKVIFAEARAQFEDSTRREKNT
jgi:3-oxocholest-4-en-26-oate---CoA ligase